MTFIYALKDPRNNEVRYIGKSNSPTLRLSQHVKDTKANKEKAEWIKELSDDGKLPIIEILEEVDLDKWQECEKKWISKGFENKWRLTNICMGGNGVTEKRVLWVDIMSDFLSNTQIEKYKHFTEEDKKRIAQEAAKAIRAFTGNHFGYDRDGQFAVACSVAGSLVDAE